MEDWPVQTIRGENHSKRSATTEPWFADGKVACTGPVGMAATRDKRLNDDDDGDDDDRCYPIYNVQQVSVHVIGWKDLSCVQNDWLCAAEWDRKLYLLTHSSAQF